MLRNAEEYSGGNVESNGFHVPLLDAAGDVLRALWRRKFLMILGIICGVGLGAAYHYLLPAVYSSRADLLVVRKRPRALPIPGVDPQHSYFQDSLGTHQALIKSPLIVKRAMDDAGLAKLSSLGGGELPEDEIIASIVKSLRVDRDAVSMLENNDAVFFVSYEGTDPEQTQIILDAVIKTYDDYLNEIHRNDSDGIYNLYVHWRDDIQTKLDEKKAEYAKLLKDIEPHHWTAVGGVNLSEQRVAETVAKRMEHLVHLTEVSERVKTLEQAKENGVNNQVLIETVSKWEQKSPEEVSYVDQLFELLLEEQTLLRTYGERHPEVTSIRERMAITARQALGPGADVSDIRLMDPIEVVMQSLRQDLLVTKKLEESLAELITDEHGKAKEANLWNETRDQLQADLESMRGLQSEVVKQLQELNVVKESDVLETHLLSPSGPGKIVMRKNPIVVGGVSVFVGLLIGSCFVVMREWSNLSFRDPTEIQSRLHLPVLGHLPYRKISSADKKQAAKAGLDPSLVVHYHPHSTDAESYRGVCNMLYFNGRAKRSKVIQITSPKAGDGKSTLAANLALTMAASGKSVVLVDGDLRMPSLHTLFGLHVDAGLPAVIAGKANLADALQDVGVPRLKVLPCGPAPANAAELVNATRFKAVLEELSEQFDYVLVDSSPLLAVSDACVVAAQVDSVILGIRNTDHAASIAEQSVEMLDSVDASVLGLVVKGTKSCRGPGGYGYGQKNLQYGYAPYANEPVETVPASSVSGSPVDVTVS